MTTRTLLLLALALGLLAPGGVARAASARRVPEAETCTGTADDGWLAEGKRRLVTEGQATTGQRILRRQGAAGCRLLGEWVLAGAPGADEDQRAEARALALRAGEPWSLEMALELAWDREEEVRWDALRSLVEQLPVLTLDEAEVLLGSPHEDARRAATAHVLALPGTIVGGAVGGIGLAVILGQAVDSGAFDPLTTMIPLSGAAAYVSAVAAAVDGENAVARAYYLEDAVVTYPGSLAKMVGVPSLILGLAFLAPGLAAAVDQRTSARAVQAALLGCSAAYGVTGISMLVLSGIREHAEQDGTLLPPGGPTASARPRLDGVTPWLDPATGRGGLAVVGRW